MGDIVLDADLIEQHYANLISGTSQTTDPISVVYDDETTISVKDNSKSAYANALSIQSRIEGCIDSDAQHLNELGKTLFKEDEDISADINDLLTY